LAELVAELVTLTPQDQVVPDKLAADLVIQFVITGDRPTIHYNSQHGADGGTNVAVVGASAPGQVTVSGGDGRAIGSQSASGANSSVVGSQAVQADRDAVVAGRDTNTGAKDQPVKEGWWVRLRKRGMVVAFATIIGAIAVVVAPPSPCSRGSAGHRKLARPWPSLLARRHHCVGKHPVAPGALART
jgi:hypothetical protein